MNNINVVTPPGTPLHVNIVTPPETPLVGEIEQNNPVGHMNGVTVIPLNGSNTPVVQNNGYHTPPNETLTEGPPNIREERQGVLGKRRRGNDGEGSSLPPISRRLIDANQNLQDAIFGAGERGEENRLPKVTTNFPTSAEPTFLGKGGPNNDDGPPPPPMPVGA